MEGFGDNFDQPEVDPAAEFLAREHDQLAGLEDELNPVVLPSVNAVPQEETSEAQPKLFASPTPTRPVTREEPEKIKKWREEQKKRLEEKDANEEKRKEELREGARKELAEWYRHHEEQIAKTKTANRNAEKQFVAESDEIEPGTEWERIAKLCDFNPKSSKTSKDVSRMRSIILQLKQTAPAPKRT
ncbi:Clathrin light chain [Cryptotermes secundus]|uniref:Clathrin light chain n=1 Tax=Cryptotermes secundus TaxID=105785 RepID=A0A2J7Q0V5_9NEOP|nr:Clathrin light chain [Cryptotermes secundus]PNF22215.1 Clathrin light chain [Cryptotermes secundus]